MAGIEIPRQRYKTQTPTPSDASVDMRPLERALGHAGETFDAVARAREESQLRKAKTGFAAELLDLYNESVGDRDHATLDERYTAGADAIASGYSEGLSKGSAEEFATYAKIAIGNRRVEWISKSKEREVQELLSESNAAIATHVKIASESPIPEDAEYAFLAIEEILDRDFANGLRNPADRQSVLDGVEDEVLSAMASGLQLHDKMHGTSLYLEAREADAFERMSTGKKNAFDLRSFNIMEQHQDEKREDQEHAIRMRRLKSDEDGRLATDELWRMAVVGEAPQSEIQERARELARNPNIGGDDLQVIRSFERDGPSVSNTETYMSIYEKIVSDDTKGAMVDLKAAVEDDQLTNKHRIGLLTLINNQSSTKAPMRNGRRNVYQRFDVARLSGDKNYALIANEQSLNAVQEFDIWSYSEEGKKAGPEEINAKSNEIADRLFRQIVAGDDIANMVGEMLNRGDTRGVIEKALEIGLNSSPPTYTPEQVARALDALDILETVEDGKPTEGRAEE